MPRRDNGQCTPIDMRVTPCMETKTVKPELIDWRRSYVLDITAMTSVIECFEPRSLYHGFPEHRSDPQCRSQHTIKTFSTPLGHKSSSKI